MKEVKDDFNFEETMQRLETIVQDLENGNLNLDDSIKKFAVEIKPYSQTIPPKISSKRTVLTESLKKKVDTYVINQAKWEAAKKFCSKNNMSFIILTEKQLLKGK